MKRWKGTTYTAFDPAKQPRMDECEVKRYAQRGYAQIENLQPSFNGIVLVSALFIPNLGVFVGSKPREARGNEDEVAGALYDKAKEEFPPWLLFLEGRREPTGPSPSLTDYYHAEDQVLIDGGAAYYATLSKEDRDRFDDYAARTMDLDERRSFNLFPPGTYIATWGRYNGLDGKAGVRPPCKEGTLEFACTLVLSQFKVSYAAS